MSGCSSAEKCSVKDLEKDMRKSWKCYKKMGQKPRTQSANRCNKTGSTADMEGCFKRKKGNVMLDLSVAKPRSKSMGPLRRLCSLCCSKKGNQKNEMEKQRILRKMDYLECELDEVARTIRKETMRKIAELRRAEQGPCPDGGAGGGSGSNDSCGKPKCKKKQKKPDRQACEEEEPEHCGRYKETKTTVHKEEGGPEVVTVTKKETLDTGGKKDKRVVTTTEDHKFDKGGGYSVKAKETYTKGCKDGKYVVKKSETVKGKPENPPNCECPPEDSVSGTHKEVKTEHIVSCDGKMHEIKTETEEKCSGSKQSSKVTVEHKSEGCCPGEGTVYEKTVTKSSETCK